MTACVLDNPIWESLCTDHRALALREGDVARYPPQVAPFLGVASPGTRLRAGLEALVPADTGAAAEGARATAPADQVFLLGPPPLATEGWHLRQLAMLVQMVCPAPLPEVDGPAIVPLGEAHRHDVLALAARVYPHYFRPRTMALGRYFGIYQEGRLAAMIGERMGMPGWREISAVCTDPDFNGRGHARRLLAWLSNDNLARGLTPFLHVSPDNLRALRLYQDNGYRQRRTIAFWSLRRVEPVEAGDAESGPAR